MGACCGKTNSTNAGNANLSQKGEILTWLPGVVNLFTYDLNGNIIAINAVFFNGNLSLVIRQLTSLVTLLEAAGVSSSLLTTIETLLTKVQATSKMENLQPASGVNGIPMKLASPAVDYPVHA